MTINSWHCLLLFLALFLSGSAWSQEKPLWEIGMGSAAGSFPAYRGASSQETYMSLIPFIVYRGERLSLDREGLRGKLFESPRWRFELSADAVVMADQDEGLRRGMPKLAPVMFQIGPSLEYLIQESGSTEWRLRLPLRLAIAVNSRSLESRGTVFHPNLAVETHNGSWELGGSIGPLFGSKRYHNYYYSVPALFMTPQRTMYQAAGGYSGMRFNIGASRYFGNFWLGMFVRYDNLHGATFVDSPLIEQKRAMMGGMALTWVFSRSKQMVER